MHHVIAALREQAPHWGAKPGRHDTEPGRTETVWINQSNPLEGCKNIQGSGRTLLQAACNQGWTEKSQHMDCQTKQPHSRELNFPGQIQSYPASSLLA
jgi:hypothetical protein